MDDLPPPLNDQLDGYRLYPAGRQLAFDLLPQDLGELKSNQPVKDTPGLLGIDKVDVQFSGTLNGLLNSRFGDLPEDDALGLILIKA